MSQHVAVVIGGGGMGQSAARRIGPGTELVLADFNPDVLGAATGKLRTEGYAVTPVIVDVSARASMRALAQHAASMGEVRSVVHTAGLSPVQASVRAILAVDLVGVALMAEEFGQVIAPGGAGVVIASMAAHLSPALTREQAFQLATTPAEELLDLPLADPASFPSSSAAYGFAKSANLVRVRAASVTWGAARARINSISPGVIATPMGQAELDGENGARMRAMIDRSNAGRVGTTADIAAAVDFLLSPAASFISGTDLLVDGGVTAAFQSGHIQLR